MEETVDGRELPVPRHKYFTVFFRLFFVFGDKMNQCYLLFCLFVLLFFILIHHITKNADVFVIHLFLQYSLNCHSLSKAYLLSALSFFLYHGSLLCQLMYR